MEKGLNPTKILNIRCDVTLVYLILTPFVLIIPAGPATVLRHPQVITVAVNPRAALQEGWLSETCLVASCLQFRSQFLLNWMKMTFCTHAPHRLLSVSVINTDRNYFP